MWKEIVFTLCASNSTPELPSQISAVAMLYPEIEKELLLAIIWKESRCKADALGASADTGLMQIVPRWHKARMEKLGVTDLFSPVQNMIVGADLLVEVGAGKNLRKALATYNGGPTPPESSWLYADSVIELYAQIKGE